MKHLVIALAMGWVTLSPIQSPAQAADILQQRCATCHDLNGPAAASVTDLRNRKGPDLFYAGNKYRADWLESWLQKPTRIRPAGMYFLDHIKPGAKRDEVDSATLSDHEALSASDASAVTSQLMALKANSDLLGAEPFVPGPAPMGEMSFDKFYGCMACHEIEPGYGGLSGPEVYTAGRRLTPEFMASFIRNPQAWNPKSLMPNKHVPEANISTHVNFMLGLAKETW